jgi:heavy metal sensor kinase
MKRFRRGHIRLRLALSFVAAFALVLLLYSLAAGFILVRDLRQQLVRHAIQDLETVEGLLSFAPDGRLLLKDDYHNHPESSQVLERLLEVRSPSGQVLLRNQLLKGRSLGETLLEHEGEGGYSEREFTLADGLRVQLVSRRHAIDGIPTVIRLAYSEEPLWVQYRSGLVALLLPLPIILLLAGVGGFLLASRLLKPVEEMARNAGEITSHNLHKRLPVNEDHGELADLAKAFNSVLVRLEQSFEQLRRFTSDASHELRTPLAAMRSVGEVGLRKVGDEAGKREVIGSMLEEVNHLTRLVDCLLTIARADAGQIQLEPVKFSALALAEECAALFEAVLEERGQRFVIEAKYPGFLTGDRLLLRQALVNVLQNAIKYTPQGGLIILSVSECSNRVCLEVEDSGPGIPDEALEKVFDRFFRVEESRSRQSGGTGLGLSIARWNVEIHGGTIEALRGEGGGCLVRILLPATGCGPPV